MTLCLPTRTQVSNLRAAQVPILLYDWVWVSSGIDVMTCKVRYLDLKLPLVIKRTLTLWESLMSMDES